VPSKVSAATVTLCICSTILAAAQDQRPTFRAGTSRVSLNVVVKDHKGRPIRGLDRDEFEVFDQGRPVHIDDFRAGEEPVSLALLIDTSGSMRLGTRLAKARQAAEMMIAQFRPADEAALLTFDRNLTEVAPFSTDLSAVRRGLDLISPFGSTSLHDAVAAAASRVGQRPSPRRAVVGITDGLDNSSDLSAAAASGVASRSDVPVYVLMVADSGRRIDPSEVATEPVEGGGVARLDDLTAPTGGASFNAETPAETSLAARQILSELRAGYVLAFTPHDSPGWHQLVVRVARKDARVRTRTGYWMGGSTVRQRIAERARFRPAVRHLSD
jgi:Ca-activated chloride channel family protein